jgi:ABC-type transport system substrate-binding protein
VAELTFGQAAGTISIGNYDAVQWGPNTVTTVPNIGITLRNQLYWPPEGIKGPPTLNLSYVNIPELSDLAVKQVGQFNKEERIQTYHRMEEIMADDQDRIAGVTSSTNWFGDPSVKNMQVAREAYNGAIPYVKYWWFDKV